MKHFLALMCLAVSLSQASAYGAELMASCFSEQGEDNIKINVYLDSSVYCDQEDNSPYKGFMMIEASGMSSVHEAQINYTQGNYSASASQGEDKIEIKFPIFNVPSMVEATVYFTYADRDHNSSMALSCSLPEYHMDCSEE